MNGGEICSQILPPFPNLWLQATDSLKKNENRGVGRQPAPRWHTRGATVAATYVFFCLGLFVGPSNKTSHSRLFVVFKSAFCGFEATELHHLSYKKKSVTIPNCDWRVAMVRRDCGNGRLMNRVIACLQIGIVPRMHQLDNQVIIY